MASAFGQQSSRLETVCDVIVLLLQVQGRETIFHLIRDKLTLTLTSLRGC